VSRVLIVDDERNMLRLLTGILAADGHETVEADSLGTARRALGAGVFDVVLTDQRMPDGDGLDLLADCREIDPALPVVVITAHASVELAVEAMRRGAFDFLAKPFHPDQVLAVVARAGERSELVRENATLRGQAARRTEEILAGESAAIRGVRELVARVAPTPATVLITGETGTGKELVARALHAASPRASRSLVAVNCAAFAESLLDSELFGHERGAFTGADRSRPGLFEAAHRGTLFLDEAGEMSLALQAKLLRAVTTGEVVRVGSTTPRRVDVRLLVATHRNLLERVEEGSFRRDLYYRLAVVPIAVPALRERLEDLPVLVETLLARIAVELKLPARPLTPSALAKLRGYAFPGNVRELRNLLERATILARGPAIGPEDLPLLGEAVPDPDADALERWLAQLPTHVDLRAILRRIEEALVARALEGADGVQAEAARRLGLSRGDLHYRLQRDGALPGPVSEDSDDPGEPVRKIARRVAAPRRPEPSK
jgi:DNA-binding NtrC family response regulator